jgi:uncharacterized GH25 family protein
MNKRALPAIVAAVVVAVLALLYFVLAPGDHAPIVTRGGASDVNASGSTNGGVELAASDSLEGAVIDPVTGAIVKRREVTAPKTAANKKQLEIPTGPKLKGRVVDEAGRGVPNAKVEMRVPLRDQGLVGLIVEDTLTRQEKTTDGLGYFELIGLPGRTVEFDVGADGYAKLEAFEMDLPERFDDPIPDLRLVLGLVLHGSVVDNAGRGIAGATLHLVDPEQPDFGFRALTSPDADATTDEQGRFELARVAVGKWAVEVRATDRPLRTFRGETNEVGHLRHALWFELPEGGVIRGKINGLDAALFASYRVEATPTEGTPFFGGRSFERPRSEIDGDGRFEIRGLDRELEYKVKLAPAQSGIVAFAGMTGTRSQEVTVRPIDAEVELDYKPGARVSFQVLDATTKKPVEIYTARFGQQFNARTITKANGETQTEHRDGRGAFVDVYESDRPGWSEEGWRLEILAPGYEDWSKADISITDGVALDLGEIPLVPSGSINLVVKDAVDGDPINSAIVTLTKLSTNDDEERAVWRGMDVLTPPVKKTKTGPDGKATIDGFGSQPAELVVSRSRYADFVQRIVLGGDDQTIEVLMAAESEVEVLARDVNDNELGDVRIEHMAPGAERVTSTISATNRGRARFRGLAPGDHRFRIAAREAGTEASWQSVSLAPGTKTTVVLLGPARGMVRGRVLEGGRPVANAGVSVRRADGDDEQRWERRGRRGGRMVSGRSETTDAEGRFEVGDLDYGDYTVEVEALDRAMPERVSVTIDRASVEVEVSLSGSVVTGIVVDTDGRPLAGVDVRPIADGFDAGAIEFSGFGFDDDPSVVEIAPTGDTPGRRTNSAGVFELKGLQAGTPITLEATHPNARTSRSESFVLATDERRDNVRIVMEPAGSIVVRIKSSGEGTRFFRVVATHTESGSSRTTVVMSGNNATFESLEPGKWKLELSRASRDGDTTVLESREVDVVVRANSEVEFTPAE